MELQGYPFLARQFSLSGLAPLKTSIKPPGCWEDMVMSKLRELVHQKEGPLKLQASIDTDDCYTLFCDEGDKQVWSWYMTVMHVILYT